MDAAVPENPITHQFLSNALGSELDIQVFKVTNGTKPGDNFTSVIYSAEVHAKKRKGDVVIRNLLIKCYPDHPSRQEYINNTNMFFQELEVYRLWMPELRRFQTEVLGLTEAFKLPYAPFVNGNCIDYGSVVETEYEGKVFEQLDNYIIMEDIRKSGGFRMTNRRDNLDMDHMRLVIHELAKIHALSWAYKAHVEADVIEKYPFLEGSKIIAQKDLWLGVLKSTISQAVKTFDGSMGVGNHLSVGMTNFDKISATVLDVFFGVKEEDVLDSLLRVKNDGRFGKDSADSVPWRIIAHGDCNSNNLMFRYDEKTGRPVEVVLVDLQMVHESCVMPDLVYLIYACMDSSLRKIHLEELMKQYVDTFNDFCRTFKTETLPGFALDSFRYRFHRFKLFGFLMAILVFPMKFKEDEQALNMEDMEHGKDIGDMFSEVAKTSGTNLVYNTRLHDIVQEMYDEGVI